MWRITMMVVAAAAMFVSVGSPGRDGVAGSPSPPALVPDRPVDTARDRLVEGNTTFALALYRELAAERPGNLFCAPYSVSVALAMTWAGARGDTAGQMARAMRFELPAQELHEAFRVLADELVSAEAVPGIELASANRLWAQQGETFRPPFVATAQDCYGGGFEAVDFQGAADDARRTINLWIAEQTCGRLTGLVQSHHLSPATLLVLTNALHLRADWRTCFDEQETRDGDFHVDDGTTATVPLMRVTEPFPYVESDGVKVVELPYAGERLSMVVLLPREPGGLPALEASLTTERLSQWLDGLEEQTVHVILPRFSLEDRRYLERTLAAMGMPLAFTPGRADLSGMCGRPGETWIDLVIHQARLDVHETGTEAAAATAVVVKRGSVPVVQADHPFMFLIRDRETGSILFLGRLVDPRDGGAPASSGAAVPAG